MGLSWTGGGNLTPGNIRSRNREMKAGKRDLTVIGCRRKQSVEGGVVVRVREQVSPLISEAKRGGRQVKSYGEAAS